MRCIVFLSVAAAANNQPSTSTANPGTGAPQLVSPSADTAVLHGDKGSAPQIRSVARVRHQLVHPSREKASRIVYLLMEGAFVEQHTSLSLRDSPSPAHGTLPVPRSGEE